MSSTLNQKLLYDVYEALVFLVETDFDISVEDGFEGNSYWIPTPEEEIDEVDCFGIIEIDVDIPIIQKIYTLSHETGHAIYDMQTKKALKPSVMQYEKAAWIIGYQYFLSKKYALDEKEYWDLAERCLGLYEHAIRSQE